MAIGFRAIGDKWRQDQAQVISFAREQGFEGIDIAAAPPATIRAVLDAGLRVGTVDLPESWSDLIAVDAQKRKDAAASTAQFIRDSVDAGARLFFTVALPGDVEADRKTNLDRATDGYGRLCHAVADTGARIVLEGWPGPAPHYPALACTPESYRALLDEVASDVLGINYDPSHLIRMGIDSLRFLDEFIQHVHHVHAKDTVILPDDVYEFGMLQPATLAKPHAYGEHSWRYTIPGHGSAPWGRILAILDRAGYDGIISVELEDQDFHGTEEAEKQGLVASRDFLIHA